MSMQSRSSSSIYEDQSDFLADVMGVPRDADFSLTKRGNMSSYGVEESGKREKSHFYRDLLMKLGLKNEFVRLRKENR